jgi:hypothetical protein
MKEWRDIIPASRLGYYFVVFLIIAQGLIAGYRPMNFQGNDILESYSAITVDGFEFIITGRAFAMGILENYPILRNPPYVLLAALDSVLGKSGFVFGCVVFSSIMVQLYSITGFMKLLKLNYYLRGAILVVFFFNFINFINLYILSDLLVISIMMLGIRLVFTDLISYKNGFKTYSGVFLIFLSSLGQFYALLSLIILLPFFVSKVFKTRTIYLSLYSASLFMLTFIAKYFWNRFITHKKVPVQWENIDFTINMFNFYINTWFYIFIPILVAVLVHLKNVFNKVNYFITPNSKILTQIFALLIVVTASVIFFYQFYESRYTYVLFVFVMYFLIIFVSLFQKEDFLVSFMNVIASLTLIFGVLWSPSNKWEPRIGESTFLRPWLVERYWERIPFSQYVELREKYCVGLDRGKSDEETIVIDSKDLLTLVEPVRDMAEFGLKNCL